MEGREYTVLLESPLNQVRITSSRSRLPASTTFDLFTELVESLPIHLWIKTESNLSLFRSRPSAPTIFDLFTEPARSISGIEPPLDPPFFSSFKKATSLRYDNCFRSPSLGIRDTAYETAIRASFGMDLFRTCFGPVSTPLRAPILGTNRSSGTNWSFDSGNSNGRRFSVV